MALIQLPKQYNKDFSQLKKKPIIDVDVDLNDLGKYLSFGTILLQKNLSDLATNKQPTNIVQYVQTIEQGNQGFLANSGSPQIEYDTQPIIDVNKPFAIIWKGRVDSVGSNDMLCTLKTVASNALMFLHESSGTYKDINWGGGSSGFSPYKIDFSEPITDILSYQINYNGLGDSASSFRAFVNGIERTVQAGGAVSGSDNDTVIANRLNGNFPYTGWLEYLFVFNKDLSALGNTLHNEVYQRTLKPRVEQGYFTAEGGGGITLTADMTTTSFTQSSSGTVVNSYTATINQNTTSFTQFATGAVTLPNITGVISQDISAFTQAAIGNVASSGIAGSIMQAASAFTQSASGVTVLNISGLIVQSAGSFTQTLNGVVVQPISGAINQNITSFTMQAVGSTPLNIPVSGGLVGSGSLGSGISISVSFSGGLTGKGRL